jgi:undecaprenyl-diphosphatase
VVALTRGFFEAVVQRGIETPDQRLSVAIAIGTIPAVIAGGLGADFIAEHLGEPWMIAIQLIVFGALLLHADRLPQRKGLEGSTIKDGLYIGLAQVLALAPGTSRSGITITAARYLGLDRDSAARFSFLLLIPIVFGATVFSAAGAIRDGLPDGVAGPMIVGTIAVAFLLRLLRTTSYAPFVYYRYAVGVAMLAIIATGLRPPTF